MAALRSSLIRLAHSKPKLREHLLPLLKEAGGSFFHALNKRHRDEANANKRYLVKSVNKGGQVSKTPFTDMNWRLDAFEDKEKAEKRVADLEKMNPGRKYTIVDDDTGQPLKSAAEASEQPSESELLAETKSAIKDMDSGVLTNIISLIQNELIGRE